MRPGAGRRRARCESRSPVAPAGAVARPRPACAAFPPRPCWRRRAICWRSPRVRRCASRGGGHDRSLDRRGHLEHPRSGARVPRVDRVRAAPGGRLPGPGRRDLRGGQRVERRHAGGDPAAFSVGPRGVAPPQRRLRRGLERRAARAAGPPRAPAQQRRAAGARRAGALCRSSRRASGRRRGRPPAPQSRWLEAELDPQLSDAGDRAAAQGDLPVPVPPALSVPSLGGRLAHRRRGSGGSGALPARAAAARGGPLPEDYFFFLEETDWCLRVRSAGWRVVHLPAAFAIHLSGGEQQAPSPR